MGNYELAEALTRESHPDVEEADAEDSDGGADASEDAASDKKDATKEIEESTQELMDELEFDWMPGEDSELKERKDS